jgi:hypothetical protein
VSPVFESSADRKQRGNVSLSIYDVTGAQVARLMDGTLDPGPYTAAFEGVGLAPGIYFAVFETDNKRFTAKVVMVK